MKRALGRYLPDEILHRRKMGFVTPVSAWFRGPLAGEAAAIAHGSALAETRLVRRRRDRPPRRRPPLAAAPSMAGCSGSC